MDKEHIERLINNYKLRLQILKEQEAIQGLFADPKIPIEIKMIEDRIADLQNDLQTIAQEEQQRQSSLTKIESKPFKVGGALVEENIEVYLEREADMGAVSHVQKMDYLLIIEPRQQGKTSLICRMMLRSMVAEIAWVYIDMSPFNQPSEKEFYAALCPRILAQLDKFIDPKYWPSIPQNGIGWRNFLSEIAQAATKTKGQIIIALDEIGATKFSGTTTFFSVLRDVYNSRQAEPHLKQLTFWLVGVFRPQDLIEDDRISPFNVAQRVYLADFTLEQVQELVSKGGWSYEQTVALARQIHYWTDGQPYLTQLLCSYLEPEAIPASVDAAVDRLRREDRNHLAPILKYLHKEEKLRDYIAKLQAGAKIKFFPGENRRHAQLELLGVVKADQEGYCMIRNRIYELVLNEIDSD